jgi:hypothetical protein
VLRVLIEKDKELPHDLLEKFPSLNKRYWEKARKRLKENLEKRVYPDWFNAAQYGLVSYPSNFRRDDYYLIWNDKELFEFTKQESKKFRDFLRYYDDLKQHSKLNTLDWYSPFPLELPLLEEVGYLVVNSVFGEVSLPKLKSVDEFTCSRKIQKLNIPSLETAKWLDFSRAEEINCSSLKKVEQIFASSVLTFNCPLLEEAQIINVSDAEDVYLPKLKSLYKGFFQMCSHLDLPELETSVEDENALQIHSKYSEIINLPKVEKINYLRSEFCKELNAPLLEIIDGEIYLNSANLQELNLPNLKEWEGSGYNHITAERIILPKLKKLQISDDGVTFKVGSVLEMPLLESVFDFEIETRKLKRIKFDFLRECRLLHIYSDSVETLNLPNLKRGIVQAVSVKIASLPELEESNGLTFRQLKKIIIDKKFKSIINRNTFPDGPVEFIQPSQTHEESVSFKNFFYLTNI